MIETEKLYFEALKKKYMNEIRIDAPEGYNESLGKVPKVLHALYQLSSKVSLPFGEIFTIEEALQQSERIPFKPNWFVFGRDNYFTFWICSFIEDEDGLSFTYWDHELGNEIEGAVWRDLVSFLKAIEDEYEE